MDSATLDMLRAITTATALETGQAASLNKSKLFRGVAKRLNLVLGNTWGSSYIQCVHDGHMQPSRLVIHAVRVTYTKMIAAKLAAKKKKPDCRLRPVQVMCSGEQYSRILKMSTKERTEKFMRSIDNE